mmetsp:Transcript_22769/g.40798  ORF Transcript_22769/g.40798 Transcript_22769/m.40798 type:complete len:1155 (+) Transcript_22769:242-3706(+)
MPKKYKKMQAGDHPPVGGDEQADRGAIPAASAFDRLSTDQQSSDITGSSSDYHQQVSSSAAPLSLASSKPASHAMDTSSNDDSPSQHLMNSLMYIDHQLHQQRELLQGDGDGDDDGGNDQEESRTYLQLSLPHTFGSGGAQGGLLGDPAAIPLVHSRSSPMPFPFSSLQQPPLRGAHEKDGGGQAQEGKSSTVSPSSKAIALTRTFSTPESRSNQYRPLRSFEGEDDNAGLSQSERVHHVADLKQAYPLLLQRSASSAFGSPAMGKFKPKRSHSNSGNSDPGVSAFHPVWSCKSLSTSSAGSVHSGSEVGSVVRSSHSDPSDNHKKQLLRKNSSPWRKVMERMKKSTGNKAGSGGGGGSTKSSGGRSLRRQLSGRENPARPNLSEDESSPVNEIGVVVVVPTKGDDICKGLLKLSFGGEGDAATARRGSATSGSKKTSKASKKDKKSKRKSDSSKGGKDSKKSESTAANESVKPTRTEKKEALLKSSTEKQYDDPGVALDLSDSDDDDDTIEPIMGNYIPWNEDHQGQSSNMPPHSQQAMDGTSDRKPRPSSIEAPCDSVEVISTFFHDRPSSRAEGRTITHVMEETAFGSSTVQVFSPATSIEENSPPAMERMTIDEGEKDHDDFPYHPLGGDGHDNDGGYSDAAHFRENVNLVQARLKYRSPQRTPQPMPSSSSNVHHNSLSCASHDSPDSRLSSHDGSPTSRISSSNSRGTNSTTLSGGDRTINTLQTEGSLVVDGNDFEVREANRRCSIRGRIGLVGDGGETNQEVVAGTDGNDTVVSSSTTSSNYHAYMSSPRPLRDGATIPVDRYFAGGNVTMSPSPQRGMDHSHPSPAMITSAPNISKFIALSPKKSSRRIGGGATREATHSPHTVSSNSVSANSSSSSETKKPLKFVAYEIQKERESSPFDEPPNNPSRNSMIKPRISKVGRHHISQQQEQQRRPPMVQRTSVAAYNPQKPPQSPRKQDTYGRLVSGARTPTRTPPPSSFPSSGANTPCSPPVIVDGPNVLCGDLSTKPTRPYVFRRGSSAHGGGGGGGRGMFLMPPPSSYRPHQHPPIPPQPSGATIAAAATSSPLRENLTVVGGGANDGAQEIVFDANTAPTMIEGGRVGSVVTTVSPDRHVITRRLYNVAPDPDLKEKRVKGDVAIVSPEKGF